MAARGASLPRAAPGIATMRRWLARALLLAAGVLLGAEALYLVAANVWLNSGRVTARISRNPGRFAIRWGAAWTLWPGQVHLSDVAMRGGSARIDWYAHLDSVGATFLVGPLFDRTVHLRRVTAAGIDYRQRIRRNGEAEGTPPESSLPPLPAVVAGPAPEARPRPPGQPRGALWTIVADSIHADIDQLWIDRYRLAGEMDLRTSMNLVVRGSMVFPSVRVTMTRGALTEGGREILGGLRFDIATSLGPFVPRGLHAIDVISLLSGRLRIDSQRASLFFLEAYFRKAPWLHFNGHSVLAADLRLDAGRLLPGSTLASHAENLDIDFLDRKLTGRSQIVERVTDEDGVARSHVEVMLDDFALFVPDRPEPFARGTGFRVSSTSTDVDLHDPFATLHVVADLPSAVIPDLSFYNRFIPAGAGFAIRGGTGRIGYHIEGNQEEGSAHGSISLTAENLQARFETYPIHGDVTIETHLKALDPRAGSFDVSGTTIDMASRIIPWRARLSFPSARVRYTEPMQGRARTVIRMTDTTPLVAIFDAKKDISRFTKRLMTIQDIEGTATVAVDEGGFAISDLDITGHHFHALADMHLKQGGKEGILYLRLGLISFGVAFDRGEKDIDLVRARAWYEKQHAARHRHHPAP
jgi:hypothetical protein